MEKESKEKRYIITARNLETAVARIRTRLDCDKFKTLNETNDAAVKQLRDLLVDAETVLKEKRPKWIFVKGNGSFRQLELSWIDFDRQYNGILTDSVNAKYKELLDSTNYTFASVKNGVERSSNGSSFRNKSTQEEQTRLEELSARRSEVKREYEKALAENPRDEERIQKLRRQLDALEITFVETKKTLDDIKTDSVEEELMRKRINDAFGSLSNDNHLEWELTKLRWEYYLMLVFIAVTVIGFFVFYGTFITHLQDLKLNGWCEYMPYTMAVPVTIGLLWLFVYLKNRASKISIELSSRLYDIRYLEGLMKMTNSMSRTSGEALAKIEELIHSLVDSFLNKLAEKPLKEKDLSVLEMKELESSPYWQLFGEVKELIKIIKK